VSDFWNRYLKDDNVHSTPSCVAKRGENKEIKVGSLEILKLIEKLKKEIAAGGDAAMETLKENRPEGETAHRKEK
jgi:hypothetical protein